MVKRALVLRVIGFFFLFGAINGLFIAPSLAQKGGEGGNRSKEAGKSPEMKEFTGRDGMPMVLVPAGAFIMGSDDWRKEEKPQRKVYLDSYYMDKYPVTNMKFRSMSMIPREDFGPKFNGENQPVVGVAWFQAKDYCTKAGKRLPTEAEWEKAARGTDGRMYPWGDEFNRKKLISETNSNGRTHPVDRNYNTHKSPFGAVDMEGNVSEWVSDWYGEDYYRSAPTRNPKGPSSGYQRVFRGGPFKFSFFGFFRVSARARNEPDNDNNFIGFRCAKYLK